MGDDKQKKRGLTMRKNNKTGRKDKPSKEIEELEKKRKRGREKKKKKEQAQEKYMKPNRQKSPVQYLVWVGEKKAVDTAA